MASRRVGYDEGVEIDAFETWAVASGWNLDLREHPHADFRYLCQDTEDRWRGWQARAMFQQHRELRTSPRASGRKGGGK